MYIEAYCALKDDGLVWCLILFLELVQSQPSPPVDGVSLQPLGIEGYVAAVPRLVQQV